MRLSINTGKSGGERRLWSGWGPRHDTGAPLGTASKRESQENALREASVDPTPSQSIGSCQFDSWSLLVTIFYGISWFPRQGTHMCSVLKRKFRSECSEMNNSEGEMTVSEGSGGADAPPAAIWEARRGTSPNERVQPKSAFIVD